MENKKKEKENGKGKSPDEYKDTSKMHRFPFRSGKKHFKKSHLQTKNEQNLTRRE